MVVVALNSKRIYFGDHIPSFVFFEPRKQELFQLDKAGIKIAEYFTELPGKELLREKLHQAIEISKKQIENKESVN